MMQVEVQYKGRHTKSALQSQHRIIPHHNKTQTTKAVTVCALRCAGQRGRRRRPGRSLGGCSSFFSVAVIELYNQKQLQEEFILAESARGVEVHNGRDDTVAGAGAGS